MRITVANRLLGKRILVAMDQDQHEGPRMEVVEQSSVPHPDDEQYETYDQPKHPLHKRAILAIIIIIVVVVLLGGGAAAYWFVLRKPAPIQQQSSTTSGQQQTTTQITPDTTVDGGAPGTYVSNGKDLNLQFTYPTSWTVSPPSNNNASDQTITVTSPLTSLDGTSGTVTGKIVFSIRPGSAAITELASGNTTAAVASTQIAYAKPTKNQHQYPYITFLHLKGGQNPDGLFEEVMITGVNQFAKGQGLTSYSLAQLDPIVSAAFYQCSNQDCTGTAAVPLSITSSTWQNDDTFKQVEAMFESLQLN